MTPKQLHSELLSRIEQGQFAHSAARQMGFPTLQRLYEKFTPQMIGQVTQATERASTQRQNRKTQQTRIEEVRLNYGQIAKAHYKQLEDSHRKIADFIANRFDIEVSDIFLPCRVRLCVEPRVMLQYVLNKELKMHPKDIASVTCSIALERTTVLHGIQTAESICMSNDAYNATLHDARRYARQFVPLPAPVAVPYPFITALHGLQSLHQKLTIQ